MAEKITPAPLTRKLSVIAAEIDRDYTSASNYAAQPYINALLSEHTTDLSGRYFEDPLTDVVQRLLSNLTGWRGETAKRVKAELKAALAHQAAERAQRRGDLRSLAQARRIGRR